MYHCYAARWAQGWDRLKMFFVLVFYFILMTMYSIHFIETLCKLSQSYNSVAKPKNKEVNMTKEPVQKSINKTKNNSQLNHPVNH